MAISAKTVANGGPKTGRGASLADALFTSTQQRVLGLLFGQPDRSFFVTQIMALAKSGRGAVQRELSRLLDGGLVTVQMVGTQKHYRANPGSPLFVELCDIIQKTVGLSEPLREAIAALPGTIELALIYGSVAKGTDSSSSDIDLLVVSDDVALEQIYATLMPAEEFLARRINPTLYTSNEFQRRRTAGNSFIERVLSGPTIHLIGTVDAE